MKKRKDVHLSSLLLQFVSLQIMFIITVFPPLLKLINASKSEKAGIIIE